jgi:hypothetical protein
MGSVSFTPSDSPTQSYVDTVTRVTVPGGQYLDAISIVLRQPRYNLPQTAMYSFVKSAESMRAIPPSKVREQIQENSVWDSVDLYAAQPGMRTDTFITGEKQFEIREVLNSFKDVSLAYSRVLESMGLCKGQLNRVVETHGYVTVLITASRERMNHFLNQRLGHDAQKEWTPVLMPIYRALKNFDWDSARGDVHIPFVGDVMQGINADPVLAKLDKMLLSIHRAGGISYGRVGSTVDMVKAAKFAFRMINSGHASTYEHQWVALEKPRYVCTRTGDFNVIPIRNDPAGLSMLLRRAEEIILSAGQELPKCDPPETRFSV